MFETKDLQGSAGGNYVKLQNDGDTVTFFIPTDSELTRRSVVWDGSKTREATPADTENVKVMLSTTVMAIEGGKPAPKICEQGGSWWSRVGNAAAKAGGSLHDHVFTVERIGDKGDKKTTYRVKVTGKAADFASVTSAAAAPPANTMADIVTELTRLAFTPAQTAAALTAVAPGVTNPALLTPDQQTTFLATLKAS